MRVLIHKGFVGVRIDVQDSSYFETDEGLRLREPMTL